MKLRNKKTVKIINSKDLLTDDFIKELFSKDFNYFTQKLDKIQKDWEYYEEPKDFWLIDDFEILCGTEGEVTILDLSTYSREDIEKLKAIGNYFETKEEAEKAVEKLKAWKRLKDKGFRFDSFDVANRGVDNVICGQAYFKAGNYDREEMKPDLEICFGGEE